MRGYLRDVTTLALDDTSCIGCLECMSVCPHGVLERHERKVRIARPDDCMECGACALNCASRALTVEAGVGCAAAIIQGALTGTEPSCDCTGDAGTCC